MTYISNNPPTDADPIHDRLSEAHSELLERASRLVEALERAPEKVEDDETAGKVADFVKQIKAVSRKLEGARKDAKEPYLESGRSVDAFFKQAIAPLTDGAQSIEKRLTVYQRAKADAERRAREEEERKAREAAEQAAAQAQNDADLDAAIQAEEAADQARREAQASNAELARTRGAHGAVAAAHTRWTFKIVDIGEIDLEKIRGRLPLNAIEQAIRGYIRDGGRELAGVEIFEEIKTVVR